MNPIALLGAVLGGIVGAVIWCLVANFTGYELPYMQWAIGGLVGVGASSLGGRGILMAFCCALICFLSIFVGKMGGVLIARGVARDALAVKLTQERYETMSLQAQSFAALPSPEFYGDFMIENGYVAEDTVTEEDLERFEAVEVPVFRRLYAEKIDYRDWSQFYAERYLSYAVSDQSAGGVVISELKGYELFFSCLGAATAFVMVITSTKAKRRQWTQAAGESVETERR